jgi:hypothetical protein
MVAFVFDLAVIAAGERPGIPNARSELLTEMNVAEPHILGLQATQRIKGILRASPDQWLTTTHPGAGHPQMPKEELVASRLLLKALVELIELPGEGIMQILLVTNHFSFPGIREDRDSYITQLNELRLSAKVYRVLATSSTKHI